MSTTPEPQEDVAARGSDVGNDVEQDEPAPECASGALAPTEPTADSPAHALAAIHDAARVAIARGWQPIPLAPFSKEPTLRGWPSLTIRPDQVPRYFGAQVVEHPMRGQPTRRESVNLGVKLGPASGGLVDVDCDAGEAVAVAPTFLPTTGLVSGRPAKPASHYWYVVAGELATVQFTLPGHGGGITTMLIELRGAGHQTMIPPSIHPSGERVAWEREGEPARVDGGVLREAVATIAAGATLARAWPGEGSRDAAALALCGMLARGGWTAERIDHFVCAVVRVAGDEEWAKRGKGQHTLAQLAAGKPVTGATALAELLGPNGQALVARLRDWLGLADDSTALVAQSAYQVAQFPTSTKVSTLSTLSVFDGGPVGELLSEVEEQAVIALFGGRFYQGMLVLLDGDPGDGKTFILLDIAARLTTGREMPDGSPGLPPCGVVYVTAEDDFSRTLKPRLRAAGGDPSRFLAITTIPCVTADGTPDERQFTLGDLDALEQAILRVDAKMVVIDPIMAFVPKGHNANSDQEMRAVLTPLAQLAARLQVVLVLVRHLNKSESLRSKYRGSGSMGILGAARSALLVGEDPTTPERKVLASNKNNLGPPPPSLAYRVVDAPGGQAVVQWEGVVDVSAKILAGAPSAITPPRPRAQAKELLQTLLAEGPLPQQEIRQAAAAAEISWASMRRAKDQLDIRSTRRERAGTIEYVWMLPPLPAPAPNPPPERGVPATRLLRLLRLLTFVDTGK